MKKYIFLAATALSLASCGNSQDNELITIDAVSITASIGESAVSRASDDKWVAGDKIGISSAVGDVAGPYTNLEYTTNGDGSFTGSPILFYNRMTLTAYYPFTGSENTVPGEGGIITANTGADSQTEENQPKIDFLWDRRTGVDKQDFSADNRKVNFTFAHKMSKLTFTFKSSQDTYDETKNPPQLVCKGVDVGTMVSYEIEGLGVEGTFDTNSGVCALDGDKERAGLKIEFDMLSEKKDIREFPSLIVFPQKNDKGYTLHITTDELNTQEVTQKDDVYQHYKSALRFTDNEIKAGYNYKFTIQVTKLGLIVGDLSIEPWAPASEKFITATIDGENEFQEK